MRNIANQTLNTSTQNETNLAHQTLNTSTQNETNIANQTLNTSTQNETNLAHQTLNTSTQNEKYSKSKHTSAHITASQNALAQNISKHGVEKT